MKLNFWQILGLILLVIGIGMYAMRKINEKKANKPNPNPPAASQPK